MDSLPKWLTTVTPVSKLIAAILLITLPFLGFYIGQKYQESLTPKFIQPNIHYRPSSTPLPTPSPLPTLFPSQTINGDDSTSVTEWTLYTNKKHKYTLTYPKQWSIEVSNADKEEDFTDATCCNSAIIRIYNKKVLWEFTINPLITGFEGPKECSSSEPICDYFNKPMVVLGYKVQRTLIRLKKNNKLLDAFISTPGQHPGFGKVGISNEFTKPDQIKYFIEYKGDSVEKYLLILDTISESLQPLP
jgi:hypothetical protein